MKNKNANKSFSTTPNGSLSHSGKLYPQTFKTSRKCRSKILSSIRLMDSRESQFLTTLLIV